MYHSSGSFILQSRESGTWTPRFAIATGGAITFNNAFTFPTADGTAGYHLQTDGSGNVTWAAAGSGGGGTVTGTGTANYISKWTGASSQGNSSIVDNATSVYISKNTIIGRNQSMNPRLVLSAVKSANLGKAETGMALCIDSGASDAGNSVGHLAQIGLGLINAYQPAAIGAMVSQTAAYTRTH